MWAPCNAGLLKIKFPKHMFIMDYSKLGTSSFIYALEVFI